MYVFFLAYESLDEGEQRLLKYLKNFSVNSRPVNISSKAVHVNVTMQIVRLDAVVRNYTDMLRTKPENAKHLKTSFFHLLHTLDTLNCIKDAFFLLLDIFILDKSQKNKKMVKKLDISF